MFEKVSKTNTDARSGGGGILLASLLALSMGNACAADAQGEYTPNNTSDGSVPMASQGDLYTYTQVDAKGPNTVTKFKYNSETGKFDPVYYRLDLKNKTYGEGSVSKGYGFTQDAEGNYVLGDGSTYVVNYEDPASKTYLNRYTDKVNDNGTITEEQFGDNNKYYVYGAYTDADFAGGKIENALFQNNSATAELNISGYGRYLYQNGGALSVTGDMESITADFIGNSAAATKTYTGYTYAYGGALYNEAEIGSINGFFKDNSAKASSQALGGAIYNSENGIINSIEGEFIENKAGSGGAIYNDAAYGSNNLIGSITGNFIGNSAGESGGAIYNYDYATIGDITGNFINNSAGNSGGAIFVNGTGGRDSSIGNITADFIGNTAAASGGAIYSQSNWDISNRINANFIGNSAGGSGGAIANFKTMSPIYGDFIGNYVKSETGALGGAIYNSDVDYGGLNGKGHISEVNANFIGNFTLSTGTSGEVAQGGAIFNESDIGNITGDFIGNYVKSSSGKAEGGAISNIHYSRKGTYGPTTSDANMGIITGDFIQNSVEGTSAQGGAVLNYAADIRGISGNFYLNEARAAAGEAYGGAVSNIAFSYNESTDREEMAYIGDIKGDFIQNSAYGVTGAYGGAVYNKECRDLGMYGVAYAPANLFISGTLAENKAVAETGNAYGGAIYNNGTMILTNASIINNYAEAGTNGEAKGGGIYSDKSFSFIADGGTSIIQGNYVIDKDGEIENNAIYMDSYLTATDGNRHGWEVEAVRQSKNTILTLSAINNGQIIINDKINGVGAIIQNYVRENDGSIRYVEQDSSGNWIDVAAPTEFKNYGVKFTGDGTGSIVLNNNIEAEDYVYDDGTTEIGRADVTLDGANLYLATRADVLDGNNVYFNSGSFNMINNSVGVTHFNEFQINGDTSFTADVDLKNAEMDRITADNYGTNSGNLIVNGMNLISDAPEGQDVTEIYFAPKEFKDNVVSGTPEVPDSGQTTMYTPIYKYNVTYDNREDEGYFLFTKGDKILTPGGGTTSTGNPSDAFNPSVLNTPVANLAAGQATINETFKYVFEHADAFTQLPSMERMAQIKNDYYALSTDYNENLDVYGTGLAPEFHNDGAWVRPYVTFESMNLKNGPDVDAITYGTLIGFDSDFEDFGHGWTGVTTGYVGYNGSQLSYSGNDTSMNGGLLGVTQTFYKGDFWTAITASAGASVGETSTMYGSEDFTSLLAGIGSKTGYNFEFKEGKYILQPIMFLSYTFVNTFDYTNAAGVKIESDPLHTIQLNPSVRFIANLKNGWQPYASVGMVWNLLNQTDTTANGISLPDMHVKPYVEYGIGVQKRWADKFTAFFQTMIRNGGRNGVALTGGFRWNLGKDPDETVNNVNKVKKVIKTLDSKVAGR